ncbi:hypothetical protein ON010_g15774 [Phytophthora cinnamomi]|nr:hypothetical protein ON010_g15774 [Phytophthora cinnamomi]
MRQVNHEQALEKAVRDLRQDIPALELQRNRLQYGGQQDIWSSVVEYFKTFRFGVLVRPPIDLEGGLKRMPSQKKDLTNSRPASSPSYWKAVVPHFEGVHFEQQRIERASEKFASMSASLNVTMSDATLHGVFPRLQSESIKSNLLDPRLHLPCTPRFESDTVNNCVSRLETIVDFISPLAQLLGNLTDTASVLERAPITSDVVVNVHAIERTDDHCDATERRDILRRSATALSLPWFNAPERAHRNDLLDAIASSTHALPTYTPRRCASDSGIFDSSEDFVQPTHRSAGEPPYPPHPPSGRKRVGSPHSAAETGETTKRTRPTVSLSDFQKHEDLIKQLLSSQDLRRERCRMNQARYRKKQQNYLIDLEATIGKLREEVEKLEKQGREPGYEGGHADTIAASAGQSCERRSQLHESRWTESLRKLSLSWSDRDFELLGLVELFLSVSGLVSAALFPSTFRLEALALLFWLVIVVVTLRLFAGIGCNHREGMGRARCEVP